MNESARLSPRLLISALAVTALVGGITLGAVGQASALDEAKSTLATLQGRIIAQAARDDHAHAAFDAARSRGNAYGTELTAAAISVAPYVSASSVADLQHAAVLLDRYTAREPSAGFAVQHVLVAGHTEASYLSAGDRARALLARGVTRTAETTDATNAINVASAYADARAHAVVESAVQLSPSVLTGHGSASAESVATFTADLATLRESTTRSDVMVALGSYAAAAARVVTTHDAAVVAATEAAAAASAADAKAAHGTKKGSTIFTPPARAPLRDPATLLAEMEALFEAHRPPPWSGVDLDTLEPHTSAP